MKMPGRRHRSSGRSTILGRAATAALLLAMLTALLRPAPVRAAAAITTAPQAAAAGIPFRVNGAGFVAGDSVTVYWDDTGHPLTSLVTAGDSFTATLAVPSDATPGVHTVLARGSSGTSVSTPFTAVSLPQFQAFVGSFVSAELYPLSITVPSDGPHAGQIYVGDISNFRMRIYAADGTFAGIQWGERPRESSGSNIEIQTPSDLASDALGNLYEADSYSGRVQKFSPDGALLGQLVAGVGVDIAGVGGVAVDKARGILYVSSGAGPQDVQEFDLSLSPLGVRWNGSEQAAQGSLRFNNPAGLEVDASGRLFVVDTGNNAVQMFDRSGNFLGRLGQQGNDKAGDFKQPLDVAVVTRDSTTDDIYVTDGLLNRVSKFTVKFKSSGSPTSTNCTLGTQNRLRGAIQVTCQGLFGGPDADPFNPQPGEMYAVSGLAADAAGNIYVADLYNYRLQKFSATRMLQLASASRSEANILQHVDPVLVVPGAYSPPAASGFHDVRGVAVDSLGNVYGSDTSSHRILKFAPQIDGSYAPSLGWGRWGRGSGLLAWPRGLGVDAADNIYVADQANNRVQKFTSGGAYLTQYGSRGTAAGQLNAPKATVIGPDGNVYVSDEFNSRVQVFQNDNPSHVMGILGAGKGHNMNQLWLPKGLAVDPRGYGPGNGYQFALYVDDPYNCRVLKFFVKSIPGSGVVTFLNNATAVYALGDSTGCNANPVGLGFPYGAGVDSHGHVFIADETLGRVWEFDDQGNLMLYFGAEQHGFPFNPGEFSSPRNVAIDAADNIYIADTFHGTIQKFAQ
jgi:sugar lactone lactonase YvrE